MDGGMGGKETTLDMLILSYQIIIADVVTVVYLNLRKSQCQNNLSNTPSI